MRVTAGLVLLFASMSALAQTRLPIPTDTPVSAAYRWLNKPVLDCRPLDDMEDLGTWSSFTTNGSAIVDARKVTKIVDSSASVAAISLTEKHTHQGRHALE